MPALHRMDLLMQLFIDYIYELFESCTRSILLLLYSSEQETPHSMLVIHKIADNESGWLDVVHSLINVIPMNDPLGPTVITLLLDECPLPSKVSYSMEPID